MSASLDVKPVAAGTEIKCPAIFLAAPASGQGKTTITAALARYHRDQGRVVKVFKMGPDYLDPQILAQASGQPVVQLDMWMAGMDYCRQALYEAAQSADLIVVEGAMGLHDGNPSSADLAVAFGIPVVLVIDVKGMAQTTAAVAQGLASYRQDLQVAGLIANKCGSQRHAQLVRDALGDTMPLLAHLARNDQVALPERHLGLVQAQEIQSVLEERFTQGIHWLDNQAICDLPAPVTFLPQTLAKPPLLLQGVRIGIAKDNAFSFIYAANETTTHTYGR